MITTPFERALDKILEEEEVARNKLLNDATDPESIEPVLGLLHLDKHPFKESDRAVILKVKKATARRLRFVSKEITISDNSSIEKVSAQIASAIRSNRNWKPESHRRLPGGRGRTRLDSNLSSEFASQKGTDCYFVIHLEDSRVSFLEGKTGANLYDTSKLAIIGHDENPTPMMLDRSFYIAIDEGEPVTVMSYCRNKPTDSNYSGDKYSIGLKVRDTESGDFIMNIIIDPKVRNDG